MATEEERCAGAIEFQRIDEAFRKGDLETLRAAVNDQAVIPNGPMPDAIGPCLVYAIYHSPLSFIRTLLEIGADPNAPANDGFPPLIAALNCACDLPGANKRTDVNEILRLLLGFGADPNQRGINDYTSLHMAIAMRNALAVQILLDGGADAELSTRIDQCETPLAMARASGLMNIEKILSNRSKSPGRRLRTGLELLTDIPGTGDLVRRQHNYRIRLRMWLPQGEAIRWQSTSGPADLVIDENGETLTYDVRIDRRSLINGLFYGVQGMRIGGTRRLRIAPQLAYGNEGVPGTIPAGAILTAEITILEGRG